MGVIGSIFFILLNALILLDKFSIASDSVDCEKIDDEVDLESIVNQCIGAYSIKGKGVVNLNTASERQLYNFFLRKQEVEVVLFMDDRSRVTSLNLGNVRRIGKKGAENPYLFIVNTKLDSFKAPKLQELYGVKIRGNRHLLGSSLNKFRRKAANKSSNIQEDGECNYILPPDTPDFSCKSANYLYLKDGEVFPADFVPTSIGGCVRLKNISSPHNFLAKLDISDPRNFDCDMGLEQVIQDNTQLCLKEFEYMLYSRNIAHKNNSSPVCKFHCYEGWLSHDKVNDISYYRQKWCDVLEGDLIIDESLVLESNLSDILLHLHTIKGKIVISNLTNITIGPEGNETTLDEIVFPSLEFIYGSDLDDIMILIDNTTLKRISFPKLKMIRGGEKAFVATESNPYLKMDEIEVAKIEAAANDWGVEVAKKITFKGGKEDAEKEDSPKEKKKNDTLMWIIVGCGVAGGLLVIAGIILITVIFVKGSAKKAKKTKKAKDSGDKKDEKPVEKSVKEEKKKTPEQLPEYIVLDSKMMENGNGNEKEPLLKEEKKEMKTQDEDEKPEKTPPLMERKKGSKSESEKKSKERHEEKMEKKTKKKESAEKINDTQDVVEESMKE